LVKLEQAVTELIAEESRPRRESGQPAVAVEPPASPDGPNSTAENIPPTDGTGAEQPAAADAGPQESEQEPVADIFRQTIRSLDVFKTVHTGGKTWSWLKLMANPTENQLQDYSEKISTFMREKLLTIGGATTAAIASIVFGIIIMVVALYFFLLDGPAMLAAIKHVSPLDENHDQELIEEFSTVSRAVVLATLLSALAQGVLAGIGLWFFGFEQVFLLTILTTCLALVPFVGAAAVWIPACVWLYAIDGQLGAAIGLAIYGTAVISMVDNLIKPWVLHGQSNLHPLLALLSVLGGVTALGPVGILIGPMIVAFLQTTLEILRKELSKLDVVPPELATESGEVRTTPVGTEAKVVQKSESLPVKTGSGKAGPEKKKKRR
jgi:predicted PurR-regulated permease PerM